MFCKFFYVYLSFSILNKFWLKNQLNNEITTDQRVIKYLKTHILYQLLSSVLAAVNISASGYQVLNIYQNNVVREDLLKKINTTSVIFILNGTALSSFVSFTLVLSTHDNFIFAFFYQIFVIIVHVKNALWYIFVQLLLF